MNNIDLFIPGIVIGVLGTLFAIVLAWVAKTFAVPRNEKVEEVVDMLPGLNCGGCGYTSCFAYAEDLFHHPDLSVTICKPGGAAVAEKLAAVLGREAGSSVQQAARLRCYGGKERARDAFTYEGILTCGAAALVQGGQKACHAGCLGFGDCIRVCAFDALSMGDEGLPIVETQKCVACGACVRACPHGLFMLIPAKARYIVACRNTDSGAQTRAACTVGCIACKLCEKECPFDAIHVINNCAVIDYDKCKHCGKCAKVCPRKIIRLCEEEKQKKSEKSP